MATGIDSIWARVPHRAKIDSRDRDDLMIKKRVMIVDDDESVTRVLDRFLASTDHYEVIAVNDPTKAVEVAHEFRPDLLVLDIIMPTLDGGEVLAEFRRDKKFSGMHVIFLTGLVSSEEIGREGYEISGHPVIPKPVGAKEFRTVVAEQLGIKE